MKIEGLIDQDRVWIQTRCCFSFFLCSSHSVFLFFLSKYIWSQLCFISLIHLCLSTDQNHLWGKKTLIWTGMFTKNNLCVCVCVCVCVCMCVCVHAYFGNGNYWWTHSRPIQFNFSISSWPDVNLRYGICVCLCVWVYVPYFHSPSIPPFPFSIVYAYKCVCVCVFSVLCHSPSLSPSSCQSADDSYSTIRLFFTFPMYF